jgi:hypothetical protein
MGRWHTTGDASPHKRPLAEVGFPDWLVYLKQAFNRKEETLRSYLVTYAKP